MVNRRRRVIPFHGFTLIELLAVIVIVSIVSLITLAAYRSLASDSRNAVAANTVSIALDNARAIAIEQGKRTMVVFRPVRTGFDSQQIAVVIATETNDVHVNPWAEYELSYYHSQAEDQMGLRFEPARGIKPRMLPEGMMVAAPVFTIARTGEAGWSGEDQTIEQDAWLCQSNLGQIKGRDDDESPGVVLGIFFETDGSIRSSFTDTGSSLAFVDFNGDGAQRVLDPESSLQNPYRDWCLTSTCRPPVSGSMVGGVPEPGVDYVTSLGLTAFDYQGQVLDEGTLLYYGQDLDESEPYVMVAPFFAIFDYEEAADFYGGHQADLETGLLRWSDPGTRLIDIDAFARAHGHVYHFNRHSGAVSK
ncbi:MAG: prepilin-type N-terminal cleavage/methylation domain-containing protein [Phycisphaerales bacterium]|nr:prepilin-type N-terminal cleavage/methylation domain-containing protein [Phycisphaerales bacterium]